MTELKSFGKPPPAVVNVSAAVMVLISPATKIPKDRSWNSTKLMMAKVGIRTKNPRFPSPVPTGITLYCRLLWYYDYERRSKSLSLLWCVGVGGPPLTTFSLCLAWLYTLQRYTCVCSQQLFLSLLNLQWR